MEQRLYHRKIHDIDELREQLTATWHNLEQTIIDSAIDQWRKRLTACVKAKGGHFDITYLYEITILVPTANRSVRSVLYLQLVYPSER